MKKKYLSIFIIFIPIIMFIPKFYLNILPFIVALSTVPIYIITRKSPSIGLMTYIGLFLFILLTNFYQGIVFLFFYGILGIFLGMFNHYLNKNTLISILNGVILMISINGMYLTLGSNFLWGEHINYILLQCLILIFCILYSLITLIICNYIYSKFYKINNIQNLIK